jgi:monoamine oxidase
MTVEEWVETRSRAGLWLGAFAGEHTSLNFHGHMEGAVRSGRRAAREIG